MSEVLICRISLTGYLQNCHGLQTHQWCIRLIRAGSGVGNEPHYSDAGGEIHLFHKQNELSLSAICLDLLSSLSAGSLGGSTNHYLQRHLAAVLAITNVIAV
jgi:hypothetical protein